MIRASLTVNNRSTLFLGLSHENISRLLNDQPIAVDLQALQQQAGVRFQDLLLVVGTTEEEITEQIKEAIPEAWADAQAAGRIRGVE